MEKHPPLDDVIPTLSEANGEGSRAHYHCHCLAARV